MNVEIIGYKGDLLTVKLHSELDLDVIEKNAHNGRFFAYLEPVIKDTTTDLQRKHYWALIGDISEYTGDPKWRIVLNMKYLYMVENEVTKEPSMARNKMKRSEAAKLIQVIIDYCLDNDIPFRKQRWYETIDVSKMNFSLIMKRMCNVCGKPHSDIHHATNLVGMGNKRTNHNHADSTYLCLCREHHISAHSMGLEEFCQRHHLKPIKLTEENLKEIGVM